MADLLEQTLCINQRFKHEYADIESVGEGGYGEVFKCRHKIDGATYALKAVRFSINKHKNEIKKILMEMTLNYHLLPDEIKKIREVIIMSRMQHKNIVRYFDSWIEKSEDQTTEYDDEYSDDESNHDNTVSEQTSGSDVIFSEGAPALKDQMTELEDSESRRYKLSELTSGSGSSILFEGGSGLNVQMSDLEDPQYKIKLYLVLYIKMEYVPYTLKGYINEQKLYSDYKKYFGFAREIAEGLQYMHSEKVVHRDLTTVNIFITANEEIKLADFGLSRIITSKNMKIETPQKKESNRDLTMCIGTPMYAAPEIETELYGPEVDLFSFGLCLFEMCYAPINTNQEKDHLFKLLRRGKLPDDFGSTHIQKRAAKLISGLLKPKPSERLSLEFIISEDFLSNDAENQEVIQEGSGMQNDKTSGGAPRVSAIAPWRPGHGSWREREKRKKENFEQRRKMQTSTTIAECKEKVTSAVSPTLVLSSKSSSQNEDSKHQDDIVVLEGNKGTTETGVMENNNDTTEAGILKNNKVTSEAAVMENNKGTTEAVGAMESNKGTNETVGVMENNKGITETVGVMESNKGTNETGVMESNKGTCTETGVTENNKNSTETEVQNAETEGDASLVTSFSNLAVSDPTLVENQEIEREDESKSSENTAQKLLMGSDKEESKVQEGDNESVHGCNNLVVCNEIRRNVEHLPKPITAETGAIPKTNFHNVRHNQIKTKLNEKKISDVKLTEAAAGDSGIVIDGDESEATIPKATCKDLPDLLTQSGHPQSDRTENIPKYKHEKDPKGVVGEVRSTDLSQNREVTSEDTGEIVNENVKDTVDHQLQYTQQMSNLSMDEGDQGDMEKVEQQFRQEVQQQAQQQQLEHRQQHQSGQGQQDHLQMKNLQEFQMRSYSSQATNQDSLQNFSRFDSSTSHSQIYQGGDGGVNVFPGGQLNVGTLSVNPPPQSGVSPGVAVPSSTVFEGDGVIIYTEDDYEIAIDFKVHLENDFPTLQTKVDLFDFIDMNMSLYASLETVLYRYRYVFIIITKNLNNDKVKARANEDFQERSFHEEWKCARIIPVWTSKDSKKFCPMMFGSLKGMPFYQRNSSEPLKKMYKEGVKNQILLVRQKSVSWEPIIKEYKKS